MTVTSEPEVYYDPYDFEIDADPYPVWKRMRDEAPLYWNEKYEFFALSRWDDVDAAMLDWKTYISGRGSVLEMIKAGVEIPPGSILFEDPPTHDLHRGLLSRVFTPKKMQALEPQVRAFCARCSTRSSARAASTSSRTWASSCPCGSSGCCSASPSRTRRRSETASTRACASRKACRPRPSTTPSPSRGVLRLHHLAGRAPLRRPDDRAAQRRVRGRDGHDADAHATSEVLGYVGLLAGAGNETTTRLIGFTGEVLGRHPDQRAEVVADRSLIPNAIEELLRYESPSPVQSRYVTRDVELHGQTVPEGSIMVLLNGSANRDERHFPDGDRFDIHRDIGRHQAFGYGIHLCLGMALARLEGRVALDEVLKRFPEWEVDYDRAQRARTSTVRGWETLPAHTVVSRAPRKESAP